MTKISTDPPAFRVRPAQPEEAGVFFAQTPEQDALMGGIGHVRMDFGGSGKEFWHTWHPRGAESLNTPEFKAELQQVVDKLRETVLKDLSSMRRFCYENGGKIPGGWSQNYGYVVETEHYEYCLRCNPVPGDYQAYLSCYDLNEQKINHAYQPLVGRGSAPSAGAGFVGRTGGAEPRPYKVRSFFISPADSAPCRKGSHFFFPL